MAADSGGEEFGDGWGADGGYWCWAAHELEFELTRSGEPLPAVEPREVTQAVLVEPAAEGGLEAGDRVGVGAKMRARPMSAPGRLVADPIAPA